MTPMSESTIARDDTDGGCGRAREGTLTARALADAQLARVAATDATIEAWAHLDPAQVRAEADRRDAAPRADRGPLHGIGIGVKDIIATADQPTQMGSAIYAGHRPDKDAECIERLKGAGGYVFGKAATTAFAFLDPAKTRNPWNPRHTPGGSSAGPAAAVAAGQVAGAIGTQTNGSVIRPAAYCGVVGFKPTKDAIPFAGVHLFSETLDQLGTFTRTVADAARLAGALADAGAIALAPARDGASRRDSPISTAFPGRRPSIAMPTTRSTRRRRRCACTAPRSSRSASRRRGARRISRIARSCCSRRRRTSRRCRTASGRGCRRSSTRRSTKAARSRAPTTRPRWRAREAAIGFFADWFADWDAVIAPPAPGPAPEGLGSTGDPSCCTLWSLTGFPAITLPIGLAGNGLPLGMQLATPAGQDDRLLAVAAWCEARLSFKGLV